MPELTINPTGETPAAQPQAAVQSETVNPVTEPAQVEEFDQARAMATIQKLRAFEKEAKQSLKELETLRAEKQQRAEAEMTEAQKLQKQAAEAQAQVAKLQADLWRRDVASETGIPSILVDRIQGATKEAMLEDAKKLAEALPKQPTTKTAPPLNPTNPANGQVVETDAQKRKRLFGEQADPFSGGGVVWNVPHDKT
jgi:hypothetical protein